MRLTLAAILLASALFPMTTQQILAQDPPSSPLTDPAYSITEAARTRRAIYFPSPDDWRNEVIYHLLTDRFDNGKPENDALHPRGRVGPGAGDIHGGDFEGITKRLPYLKSLGVTTIWISPVQLNSHGQYHGYHTFDFTRIDPHWGTMEELRRLIENAHAEGMRVVIDVICNHMANLIEAVPSEGGQLKYIAPPEKHALRWRNESLKYPPPFDDLAMFHAQGPIDWEDPLSVQLGELSNLDDLDTSRRDIRDYLIKVFKDLITATDCDGFRVDTVKHVEPDFWIEWNREIRDHASRLGKRDFLLFGEVWVEDPARMLPYIATPDGKPIYASLLDFPTKNAVIDVFAKGTSGTLLLQTVDEEMRQILPPFAYGYQTRFLDNHDGARFLWEARTTEPDEQVRMRRLMLAMAWHATTPGIPIIYYGTEQGFEGIPNDRGWSSSREDMFDGPYGDGNSLGDSFKRDSGMFKYTRMLLALRAKSPALRTGEVEWLVASEAPGLGVYRVTGPGEEWLVALNTNDKVAVPMPKWEEFAPGAKFEVELLFQTSIDADLGQFLVGQLDPLECRVVKVTRK